MDGAKTTDYDLLVMGSSDSTSSAPHRRRPQWLLALLTAGLVIVVSYVGLELVARSEKILDKDRAGRIAAAKNSRSELNDLATRNQVAYGWDRPPILIPTDDTANMRNPDILFVGDSVTRGFSLADPLGDSYPALLQEELSVNAPIHVVNVAVPGFGIDQMVLKLASELVIRKPRLVVVAYIPHDLYRSGRNINFGATKPVLSSYSDGSWKMRPAPDLVDFYLGYLDARSKLRLGAWWLQFIADNQQYYLPMLNQTIYETRFQGIRENLGDLADKHGVRILLIRLANGELDNPVASLDQWAIRAFSAGTGNNPRFVDVEPCASRLTEEMGLDFDQEFERHPSERAHAIFASCLVPIVAEELAVTP